MDAHRESDCERGAHSTHACSECICRLIGADNEQESAAAAAPSWGHYQPFSDDDDLERASARTINTQPAIAAVAHLRNPHSETHKTNGASVFHPLHTHKYICRRERTNGRFCLSESGINNAPTAKSSPRLKFFVRRPFSLSEAIIFVAPRESVGPQSIGALFPSVFFRARQQSANDLAFCIMNESARGMVLWGDGPAWRWRRHDCAPVVQHFYLRWHLSFLLKI